MCFRGGDSGSSILYLSTSNTTLELVGWDGGFDNSCSNLEEVWGRRSKLPRVLWGEYVGLNWCCVMGFVVYMFRQKLSWVLVKVEDLWVLTLLPFSRIG